MSQQGKRNWNKVDQKTEWVSLLCSIARWPHTGSDLKLVVFFFYVSWTGYSHSRTASSTCIQIGDLCCLPSLRTILDLRKAVLVVIFLLCLSSASSEECKDEKITTIFGEPFHEFLFFILYYFIFILWKFYTFRFYLSHPSLPCPIHPPYPNINLITPNTHLFFIETSLSWLIEFELVFLDEHSGRLLTGT